MLQTKLGFLTSTRFYQFAVAIGIIVALNAGYIDNDFIASVLEMVALLSGTAGAIGTVDRFGEKIGNK